MRRAGWLIVLLVAGACGPGEENAEVSETQGAVAAVEADAVARAPLPWPEQALPAFKALYAGSWNPAGPEGFDEQWFDEAALVETYTMRRAGRRIWQGLRSSDGVMPLDLLIRDRTGPAVGFVFVLSYRRPEVPGTDFSDYTYSDQQAILHVQHQGRTRILYDGVVVIDVPAPPSGEVGHAQAEVTLTDGFDVLLAKVGRGSPELGSEMNFEVRLSDLDGAPIVRQGWNTMRASDAPSELVAEPDSDG